MSTSEGPSTQFEEMCEIFSFNTGHVEVERPATNESTAQFKEICEIFGFGTEEELYMKAGVVITGPGLHDFTVTEYQPLGPTWSIANDDTAVHSASDSPFGGRT